MKEQKQNTVANTCGISKNDKKLRRPRNNIVKEQCLNTVIKWGECNNCWWLDNATVHMDGQGLKYIVQSYVDTWYWKIKS